MVPRLCNVFRNLFFGFTHFLYPLILPKILITRLYYIIKSFLSTIFID
nr:MAG TPA: hypothetical protein [Caudoviricetes sp.]